MALTIILNGVTKELDTLDSGVPLSELVAHLGLKSDRVAIECNGDIALRLRWQGITIHTGDRLEVVHFVGGGSIAGPADECT